MILILVKIQQKQKLTGRVILNFKYLKYETKMKNNDKKTINSTKAGKVKNILS